MVLASVVRRRWLWQRWLGGGGDGGSGEEKVGVEGSEEEAAALAADRRRRQRQCRGDSAGSKGVAATARAVKR